MVIDKKKLCHAAENNSCLRFCRQ